MIGRIVGVIAGAAIAVTGYGMLKPATFAKYFDFSKLSLGPFVEYKTLVCWLIVAVGAAVVLAALQRPSGGARKKRAGPVIFAPAEPEPAHAAPLHSDPAPAPEAHHDDHGHHDAHAHDDHVQEDHGRDSHDHGHDDHGHHEPEPHGREPAHAH